MYRFGYSSPTQMTGMEGGNQSEVKTLYNYLGYSATIG